MNIVIFEDSKFNNLYPISMTKPVWEIRSGCFTQRERIEKVIQDQYSNIRKINFFYLTRVELVPLFKEKYPQLNINDYSFYDNGEDILFINSTVILTKDISKIPKNTLVMYKEVPVIALIEPDRLKQKITDIPELMSRMKDIQQYQTDLFKNISYIWDLIKDNGSVISEDFTMIEGKKGDKINNSVTIIGESSQLYIEDNVRIDPFVCIDLKGGPVIIRKGTVINSFSRIEGPCCIGQDCIVLGAKIRKGCSFGDYCRIGGEIEETIFHGYSNKYHDGFIGHSYIGEWVNIGALTTNSDLKNNYTDVKVFTPQSRISSNSIKVGCFMGDFTKTSIGTLINTGASIGPGAMLVHSGTITPPHIPPFAWFINNRILDYGDILGFIKSCRAMTSRRGVDISNYYEDMLINLYETTNEMRKEEILKWKKIQK
ncbi:MAG: putative sugar nucleotidyl transferase [Spirochaetota bacterium]|nr:putative sugar nucleotidyl transferase [Spirochaetota bacterium]